jgi:hypothetical protein
MPPSPRHLRSVHLFKVDFETTGGQKMALHLQASDAQAAYLVVSSLQQCARVCQIVALRYC